MYRYWTSAEGLAAFRDLLAAMITPPPPPNDPEVRRELLRAVMIAECADGATINLRVAEAARHIAERLQLTRERAARFHDFEAERQPARNTPRGLIDRDEGRVEMPAPPRGSNPFFAQWMHETGTRASDLNE